MEWVERWDIWMGQLCEGTDEGILKRCYGAMGEMTDGKLGGCLDGGMGGGNEDKMSERLDGWTA